MSSRLTTGATASAIVLATLVELGVPSQLGVSLAAARCPNDCSGKGYCDAGVCVCDPGWRGEDCGELALVPAPSLRGAYQHPVNLADCATSCGPSSWGGLPLRDDNGTWHLFASQFVQNCIR